ncbi:hypothetical protein HAX54_023967 [Datura stramonium]|uniref:Cation efflux protein transmembrane domain-containing protein n=1 Tax=Datura stramonium TaxID=4076 RepID=A0ABS8S5Z3_DATST|nr:hypothetical protein [Datura stramonium]
MASVELIFLQSICSFLEQEHSMLDSRQGQKSTHLLSDVVGFSISLFAVWVSGWNATKEHSFGYHRLEVLGALISVQLIWLISGFLIYEATERMFHTNAKVNGKLMFAIAAFGLIINFISVVWLGHDHSLHSHSFSPCKDHDHDYDHEMQVIKK